MDVRDPKNNDKISLWIFLKTWFPGGTENRCGKHTMEIPQRRGDFQPPLEWKFQGIGGCEKKPSWGRGGVVWIFSGTTHYMNF